MASAARSFNGGVRNLSSFRTTTQTIGISAHPEWCGSRVTVMRTRPLWRSFAP
jgi:hypothetical protein